MKGRIFMCWRVKIRKLCKEFCIPNMVTESIIMNTNKCVNNAPEFYKGNENNYLYDVAQRYMKNYITNN